MQEGGKKACARGELVVKGVKQLLALAALLVIGRGHGQVAPAWAAYFNGPANRSDEAYDLKVDASGNVYVTGQIQMNWTYTAIVTIKYNWLGVKLWEKTYAGTGQTNIGRALEVDGLGNVYVTGTLSYESHDIGLLKYAPDGQLLWAARFDGRLRRDDGASSMALDSQGNVYVAGAAHNAYTGASSSSVPMAFLIKYDGEGRVLWHRSGGIYASYGGNATAVKVDESGNPCITGQENQKMFARKYSSTGEELWSTAYSLNYGTGYGLAINSSGEVYVVATIGVSGYAVFGTFKYGSNGQQLWSAFHGGGSNHRAFAIALDRENNVYVVGDRGWSQSMVTVKYNDSGQQQWARLYPYPPSGGLPPQSIFVDALGYVYSSAFATIKYSPAGEQLWVAGINRPDNGTTRVRASFVDGFGNVYATGDDLKDCLTVKYVPAFVPKGFFVAHGTLVQGDELTVRDPDDQRLIVSREVLTSGGSAVQVEFTAYGPTNRVSQMGIRFEGFSTVGPIEQTTELYDFAAGAFVQVDVRLNAVYDVVTALTISDPLRFIDGRTGQMRGRCTWRTSYVGEWNAAIDQFAWIVS
jgi:hypothetical protein